jgi:hypothetical protein
LHHSFLPRKPHPQNNQNMFAVGSRHLFASTSSDDAVWLSFYLNGAALAVQCSANGCWSEPESQGESGPSPIFKSRMCGCSSVRNESRTHDLL